MKKSFRILVYTIHLYISGLQLKGIYKCFLLDFFRITQVVHKWNHHMHEDRPIT